MTAIGVDETSRRRGHNHISVFMDLDNERGRVPFVTAGTDAGTVRAFKQDLEAHSGRATPGQSRQGSGRVEMHADPLVGCAGRRGEAFGE